MKKFYDTDMGGGGSVIEPDFDKSKEDKIIIECECGTHMLKVMSHADFYNDKANNKVRVNQTFYLAMFSYGNSEENLWRRIRLAFKYLKTGKMFDDQLCLEPSEAKRLSEFLDASIIPTDND